jgi:hypothetical protein
MDQVLMDNYLNCSGADPPVIEIIGHDQHNWTRATQTQTTRGLHSYPTGSLSHQLFQNFSTAIPLTGTILADH